MLQSVRGDSELSVDEKIDRIYLMMQKMAVSMEEIRRQLEGKCKEQYTIEEVADFVRRSEYTVRRGVREGRLRAERMIGTGPKGRLLISRAELSKLIPQGKGAALSLAIVG
jgi:excisionase family DNA binding protein